MTELSYVLIVYFLQTRMGQGFDGSWIIGAKKRRYWIDETKAVKKRKWPACRATIIIPETSKPKVFFRTFIVC